MSGIIVDIGTGDGTFVYKLAKKHPDRLFIGIDPNHTNLVDTSSKIYKKPQRGGLKNAFYILASVEALPDELVGIANQVFINYPWRSLLAGIVKCDKKVWKNIKKICKKGAFVDLIIGYDKKRDISEIKRLALPDFDEAYIRDVMTPRLQQLGFRHIHTTVLSKERLAQIPTKWSKKHAFGKNRTFFNIRLEST